jgi:mannosyltransferase OCH1-like enzyme
MLSIPKIIHQIWWQGMDKLPEKYHSFKESWINHHPGWKIMYWDKTKIYDLIKFNYPTLKKTIENYPYMIQKIDMAKYLILYHYGGFYLDMDTICHKSLSNLYKIKEFSNYDLICSQMEVLPCLKIINNGIIFSKARHPILLIILNKLEKYQKKEFYQNQDLYIMQSTGPIFYHQMIDEYKTKSVLILPETFFESCSLSDYQKCSKKGEYMTHHHTLSWTSNLFKYFVKTLNKIEKIRLKLS